MATRVMGEQSVDFIPELIKLTHDRNRLVAHEAITALGMIGPAAKDAIPTLEKLTDHEDTQISERAKAALRLLLIGRGLSRRQRTLNPRSGVPPARFPGRSQRPLR